jgi:hypothetical protein
VIAKYARMKPASNPTPNSSEPSIRAKAQNLLRLQQKRLNDDTFLAKDNGLRRGLETVTKGIEKSNNLAGNLTGWRASYSGDTAARAETGRMNESADG